ncbi:MAG: alpha/beta hydrolase fold domain-containing protein [Hyphomicrobiaceae bacterium]
MAICIERDIVYGYGGVGCHEAGGPRRVALKLDAYLPAPSAMPAAAIVMAFGGAFHRGSKEDDTFSDGTGTNTSIAEYCRRFAELGLAAFSVEYRLAQADPEPGTALLSEPDRVPMSRINPVRAELGLPQASARMMAGIMEAAFDDVASALSFVVEQADAFRIDRDRVVLGGFSAGGRCAMYVAYGKRFPVRGVISISGPLVPVDCAAFLRRPGDVPPLLMISGEQDLDYVRTYVPEIEQQFREAGRAVSRSLVPGATHFFPAEAPTEDGRTVMQVMAASLATWGCLPSR